MTTSGLALQAQEIFLSVLRAVDARTATRRAVSLNNSLLCVGNTAIDIAGRSVYLVAIGKAAAAMTAGLTDVLGDRISNGIVCGPIVGEVNFGWPTLAGGHPLPTEDSIAAARATLRLLAAAERNAVVIFLISGGGSAMFELPIDESIRIEELREANRQLILCGASISEINAVRLAFSAVKGGKLATHAPHTDQVTLIVSDTNAGDVTSVASGPTIAPKAAASDAREVVQRYGLVDSLPQSILEAVAKAAVEPGRPATGLRERHVLLDNTTALEAAAADASARGFPVEIASDINEQEIGVGSSLLISRAQALWNQHGGKPVCLLAGGEFSCAVRGGGVGGRNQETVLRCAMNLNQLPRTSTQHWTVLSAGTDGVDGNSSAAGAWADEVTIAQGLSESLVAAEFLERSDAFHFFEQLGKLIVTGPTGTNVRDVRIVLVGSRVSRPITQNN